MIPTLRIYEAEQSARDAARMLAESGFDEDSILLITPTPGEESKDVRAAVAAGLVPGSHMKVCTRSLQQGRAIVAVSAHFGRGEFAVEIMERCGPVDTQLLPAYSVRNPSPLSDLLGLPTLAHKPFEAMKRPSFSLSSVFGIGLLSRNPTPLSSQFGLETLSAPKRPWRSSFGLPLLSRNAAPLSSLFGLKTISAPKKRWTSSFGLPLLSKNPTPLSSLLGIPVLRRDRD